MCQLVQENRLQLVRLNLNQRPSRQQYHGPEISDGRGNANGVADAQCYTPTFPGHDGEKPGIELIGVYWRAGGTQAAEAIESMPHPQ
jgi:hypothetical protein